MIRSSKTPIGKRAAWLAYFMILAAIVVLAWAFNIDAQVAELAACAWSIAGIFAVIWASRAIDDWLYRQYAAQ